MVGLFRDANEIHRYINIMDQCLKRVKLLNNTLLFIIRCLHDLYQISVRIFM